MGTLREVLVVDLIGGYMRMMTMMMMMVMQTADVVAMEIMALAVVMELMC
jgi:hypothetical protein